MPEEPRYTEAQWRTKVLRDECAADGHRIANYVGDHEDDESPDETPG